MTEEKLLNIEIDGRKAQVPKGTLVIEAAKQLGVFIPTLCYHESLPMYASCRICIVEMSVTKRGKTYNWIDASCVYPVEDGLVVQTNTPKVRKERKVILELLLSRAPESPLLNEMAKEYGAEERFETKDKGESNCILCGLCVRACHDVMCTGGISIAFRGINKKLVSPYQVTKEICIACNACANVCPTGAIKVSQDGKNLFMENWDTWHEMKACSECGKSFAPVVHLKTIKKKVKLNLREDIFEKCPECRRRVSKLVY
ncbi:2Fe-2S iron-sulfur cluster-binding protein [Fibrobacterota bacterium]